MNASSHRRLLRRANSISPVPSLVALLALAAGFSTVHAADGPAADALSLESTANKPSRHGWITTKVKAELLALDVNEGARVHVQTVRGVVTLTGTVSSREVAEQIRRAAERPFGVKSVETSGLTVDAHQTPAVSQ